MSGAGLTAGAPPSSGLGAGKPGTGIGTGNGLNAGTKPGFTGGLPPGLGNFLPPKYSNPGYWFQQAQDFGNFANNTLQDAIDKARDFIPPFSPYFANQPATNPPLATPNQPPPFTGGQMPGVMFRVQILQRITDSNGSVTVYPPNNTVLNRLGRINGLSLVTVNRSQIVSGTQKGKWYVNVNAYLSSGSNNNEFIGSYGTIENEGEWKIGSITRVDNLPDTGGNPPGIPGMPTSSGGFGGGIGGGLLNGGSGQMGTGGGLAAPGSGVGGSGVGAGGSSGLGGFPGSAGAGSGAGGTGTGTGVGGSGVGTGTGTGVGSGTGIGASTGAGSGAGAAAAGNQFVPSPGTLAPPGTLPGTLPTPGTVGNPGTLAPPNTGTPTIKIPGVLPGTPTIPAPNTGKPDDNKRPTPIPIPIPIPLPPCLPSIGNCQSTCNGSDSSEPPEPPEIIDGIFRARFSCGDEELSDFYWDGEGFSGIANGLNALGRRLEFLDELICSKELITPIPSWWYTLEVGDCPQYELLMRSAEKFNDRYDYRYFYLPNPIPDSDDKNFPEWTLGDIQVKAIFPDGRHILIYANDENEGVNVVRTLAQKCNYTTNYRLTTTNTNRGLQVRLFIPWLVRYKLPSDGYRAWQWETRLNRSTTFRPNVNP